MANASRHRLRHGRDGQARNGTWHPRRQKCHVPRKIVGYAAEAETPGFRTAGDYETAAAALPSRNTQSSLLNVLDRVDDPAGLIDITLEHLEPGGVL